MRSFASRDPQMEVWKIFHWIFQEVRKLGPDFRNFQDRDNVIPKLWNFTCQKQHYRAQVWIFRVSCFVTCPHGSARPTPLLNQEANGVDEDTFNSAAFYVWRAWPSLSLFAMLAKLFHLLLVVMALAKVWSLPSSAKQAGSACYALT